MRLLAVLCLLVIAPLDICAQRSGGAAHITKGNIASDGSEAQVDFPHARRLKNKGGRDGAGLCVFTSFDMASDWHNEDATRGFRDWMTKHPGGGYPSKVRQKVTEICQERGVEEPDYLQIQGNDIELLAKAIENGHFPCVTYAHSPTGRYGGVRIAHMVNLVAARCGPNRLWAILDNNFPETVEWMTEQQFIATYTGGSRDGGWGVILLSGGPPPVPLNRKG